MELEKINKINELISHQLISDDSQIREKYLEYFSDDISKFTNIISSAFLKYENFNSEIKSNEKRRSYLSLLVFSAISLQVISMRLFLSGHFIPAGNIQRQAIEAIILAILCSGKNTKILDMCMTDSYKAKNLFPDIKRYATILNVNNGAISDLEKVRSFYHSFSHPTSPQLLASYTSVSKPHCFYTCSSFDDEKLENYKSEMAGRIGLSELLENFIDAINKNVSTW